MLNYTSQAWNPSNRADISQVKSVQRKFCKWLKSFRDMSFSEHLERLSAVSLHFLHCMADLIVAFKCISGPLSCPSTKM